jgi:hypothetical protein
MFVILRITNNFHIFKILINVTFLINFQISILWNLDYIFISKKGFWALSYIHLKVDIDFKQPYIIILQQLFVNSHHRVLLRNVVKIVGCYLVLYDSPCGLVKILVVKDSGVAILCCIRILLGKPWGKVVL